MKHHRKKTTRKSVYYYCRLLHIYISTALFTLLIFFCVSGYFLNHLDTFGGSHVDDVTQLPLKNLGGEIGREDLKKIAGGEGSQQLQALLKGLRQYGQFPQPSSVEADVEMGELIVDFDLPAGYASAIISVETQSIDLEFRQGDWLAIVNDLHKGRHTGDVWAWVIDVSALLMILFAITGMVILFQNRRQRVTALWLLLAGTVTPLIIYVSGVPKI